MWFFLALYTERNYLLSLACRKLAAHLRPSNDTSTFCD